MNSPWVFGQVWSIIKGWLNEKTRNAIIITKGDPLPELQKHLKMEQIPDFLGGNNTQPVWTDWGPWNDFEVVDGAQPGDVVGICRKGDQERKVVFTPQDFESLPNPLLDDPENSVR